jgi:hypothetical protein
MIDNWKESGQAGLVPGDRKGGECLVLNESIISNVGS